MARPSEEFERSVVELEKKVGFVEMWGKVVCLSGGILLGVLGWNMNAMMAASAQAKADAAGALESLTQAKADATMEIQAKGVALLEGYRGQFAGWVAEHTAAVAPRGLAVAWHWAGA